MPKPEGIGFVHTIGPEVLCNDLLLWYSRAKQDSMEKLTGIIIIIKVSKNPAKANGTLVN